MYERIPNSADKEETDKKKWKCNILIKREKIKRIKVD